MDNLSGGGIDLSAMHQQAAMREAQMNALVNGFLFDTVRDVFSERVDIHGSDDEIASVAGEAVRAARILTEKMFPGLKLKDAGE